MKSAHEMSAYTRRLEDIASRPRRNETLHWTAFVLSLGAFVILVAWGPGFKTVPDALIALDIALSVAFAVEFLTRSGLRWEPTTYIFIHFFDFIAMAPALILVHHGFPLEGGWLWLLITARGMRTVDRLLGDGFFRRNFFALAEGFEEEITDRVLANLITRVQADLDRGQFGHKIAESLERNKANVLKRARESHPQSTFTRIVGLDAALERTEERTYDAIVEFMDSTEVDHAIRDAVNSTFTSMREQIEVKTWRKHLGLGRVHSHGDNGSKRNLP